MTKAKEFTWALQVSGQKIDIDDTLALYGENSDPSIHQMNGGDGQLVTVLTSPQFELLSTATEVDEVATRLLKIINGTLFVVDPGRAPLASGGIRKRSPNGGWDYHLVAGTGHIISRSRARGVGVAIINGEPSPEHTCSPAAARWSAAAHSDQTVSDVLMYLSGEPDWFNFYKAFELMRDDINKRGEGRHRQQQMGWPAKKDLDHFTLSAQVYRHAPPWKGGYTPARAMPLNKAARYIQSLVATWLTWRFP